MKITCAMMMIPWLAGMSLAADPAWLDEVTQPPVNMLPPFRALTPLLTVDELKSADALARWKKQQEKLLTAWKEFLGPMPARPKSNTFEVLRTDPLDGVTRQLIRYENEPGQTVEAYLLQPAAKTDRLLPGLVVLHPTTVLTIDESAGVKGEPHRQHGLRLAERGFAVICPRNFLWHEAEKLDEAVARFRERHPGTLGMHKMLYDAQRATDILAGLPGVDPQRLGTMGHSLGAKEVLYLMAFDDRLRAGVFSEGGIAFDSTNWNAPWYLGTKIDESSFPRNHHELLALIAPRPLLILAGETGPGAADGNRSWPYVAAAQPVWKLYGDPVRLGVLNHRQGHAIPAEAFGKLTEWLHVYTQR